MRILGVDPGYGRLGIAVIEKGLRSDTLVFSTCLETDKKSNLHDRLVEVGSLIESVIKEHSPSCMAIEDLFFSKNQKTAMQVAEARGIILYEAKKNGLEIFEYKPVEVKVAITGYGNSDKSQIIAMIPRLVKFPPRKMLDDEYDAIGIALTHSAHTKLSTKGS
jgi:crossover junction endodeoxyribonuclease RuvC